MFKLRFRLLIACVVICSLAGVVSADKLEPEARLQRREDQDDVFLNLYYLPMDGRGAEDDEDGDGESVSTEDPAGTSYPLEDADDISYFGPLMSEPVRLTDTSFEEFQRYARRGIPVIVTDVTRDWAMKDWTCQDMAREFKGDKMRQEYTGKQGAEAQKNTQRLDDTNWMTKEQHIDNGPEGPQLAPLYFDIKDRKGKLKHKVKAKTQLPYFMRGSSAALNSPTVNSSAEFWLSTPGAGAKAHSDPHCEATMSVQLSGSKRWRLGMSPRLRSAATARRVLDGDVNTSAWKPNFDFVLHPGEGIFFPPGMVHETTNVGGTCAVSVTFQWGQPAPTTYIREFMPRLVLGATVSECPRRWVSYVTMSPRAAMGRNMQDARRRWRQLFALVDRNGDGQLSHEEILSRFKKWSDDKLSEMLSAEISGKRAIQVRSALAEDSLSIYDTNGDNVISEDEFKHTFLHWAQLHFMKQRFKPSATRFSETLMRSRCEGESLREARSLALEILDTSDESVRQSIRDRAKALRKGCQKVAREFTTFVRQTRVLTTAHQSNHGVAAVGGASNQRVHDDL